MTQPRVAIVILNFNTRNWLEKFLPSVLQTQYDNLEIIVADNASKDDSVAFLKQNYPQIRIIQLEKNYGFTGGYNNCLQQVQADYYVLLNSDVEVSPNWVQPVINLLESTPNAVACQPKILSWHEKQKFEYAGAAGGYLDKYAFPFCRGRFFDHTETDEGQYNDAREVFWATGAALFIKAGKYHEVGGFDNRFFAHMEEIDMCWRLKNRGYKILVQPQSVVYHVGGGTLSKQNPRKTFLNFHNGLAMMVKNMPEGELRWKLPFRVLLDGIAAISFLVKGHGRDMIAVFKAHLRFFSQIRYWLGVRRELKKQINNRNSEGVYNKSVVFDFFIRKKRKFSELTIK